MIRLGLLFGLLSLAMTAAAESTGADFMFSATVKGRPLEGRPLTWSKTNMTLLGRDGSLYEFAPRQARNAKKTSAAFHGYTSEQMRPLLYQELGKEFDFTSTNHYLVAHPRGERGVWAQRFEDLYRSFVRYFRVRGFSPTEPAYPLVAVVFRNASEYRRYVDTSKSNAPTGALGHYEPVSNRVYLYDQSSAGGDDRWDETFATVIHEATHQTAYNVGVHTRFASNSRWVSEGLATMFEARGVHDARSYDRGSNRINQGRLADFRREVLPNKSLGTLENFLASDQAFDRTPILAYAQAWALTFYLCETRPQQYAAYLAKTTERPLFSEYKIAERVADFRQAFGDDLVLLEAQFHRYMERL